MQPDFTELFFAHFAEAAPVRYELRKAPYTVHDAVFLSSLIHDARLIPSQCIVEDQTMTIPLERDRWELYRDKGTLESCRSRLVFLGVEQVQWSGVRDNESEHQIDYLWVNESYRDHQRDTFDLVLAGEEFRLVVTVQSNQVAAWLRDEAGDI